MRRRTHCLRCLRFAAAAPACAACPTQHGMAMAEAAARGRTAPAAPAAAAHARAVVPKSMARMALRFCAYAMRRRSSSVLEHTILPLADAASTPPELRAYIIPS